MENKLHITVIKEGVIVRNNFLILLTATSNRWGEVHYFTVEVTNVSGGIEFADIFDTIEDALACYNAQ